MISPSEGKILLKLARDSIATKFSGNIPELKDYEKFSDKQGVFVTIHKDSELRGCIGYPEPVMPLNEAIINAARAAGFEDPRFSPLKKEELDTIKIEISVLTVPILLEVKIPDEFLKKIKIGRDGLIIRAEYSSGLLLPQVPVEHKWDVKEYLFHLSMKAGLQPDAWTDLSNKIYSFQAQIFSE